MNVLLTGGCGYIGSHILIDLIINRHKVIVIDNLCNSDKDNLKAIEDMTNTKIKFYEIDLRNKEKLDQIFSENKIDVVIHLAGLKNNPESIKFPLRYYESNVSGSINLFSAMLNHKVFKIIFSSSATVYKETEYMPLNENSAIEPKTPYGNSKRTIEQIMESMVFTNSKWKVIVLRYFNPAGAHSSGLISESHRFMVSNLMNQILYTADNKKKFLNVYGDDYNTEDGTGVRDYVHVSDLSKAHILAFNKLLSEDFNEKFITVNIGSGKGYSVKEMIKTFEKINNIEVKFKIQPRRSGDIAKSCTSISFAKSFLNWEPNETLNTICKDSWNSYKKNSNKKI